MSPNPFNLSKEILGMIEAQDEFMKDASGKNINFDLWPLTYQHIKNYQPARPSFGTITRFQQINTRVPIIDTSMKI